MQFRHPLEKMLEEQYGAAIVIDELNDFNWDPIDPDEPFEGLAKRAISIPFNGTIATRVEHLQKLARQYRVHGAVNPCNWGCRQGTGARGLIEAGLAGDRGPGPQPGGGLRGRPEVHRGAGPHPAGGLPGDAGGTAIAVAVTLREGSGTPTTIFC